MQNNEMHTKTVLFKIRHLKKYFPLKRKGFSRQQNYVHANESISLDIYRGETLGLVGESGCGKSTLGRTLLQIYPATEGQILYYGATLGDVNPNYARRTIAQIPTLYPEYVRESEELKKMMAEAEKQVSDGRIADAELLDKILQKRRDIDKRYGTMRCIAGGLLVHDDLNEVSRLLKEKLDADAAYCEVKNEIEDLKNSMEMSKVHTGEKQRKISELETESVKLLSNKESRSKAVEDLRDTLRLKEGFAELEAEKDEGIDLSQLSRKEIRPLRKDMQIIFQDPYSSLDTRMTLGNIIGEGVIAHKMLASNHSEDYNEYIKKVMSDCGLAPYFIHRYPHQFSGGQRQRIGIARALAVQPRFVVCDEAVSALDVSIQSQIINLLSELKEQRELTYLFITHDLSVVKYISDRIAVMYLGMVVELTDSDELFTNPLHPYTKALLKAIPRTDVDGGQKLTILEGDIPSAVRPPGGCRFHTRCIYCMERCTKFEPELTEVLPGHQIACHLMDMNEAERGQYMNQKDKEELARLEAEEERSRQAISKIQGK